MIINPDEGLFQKPVDLGKFKFTPFKYLPDYLKSIK
jgi:hypothetical protein